MTKKYYRINDKWGNSWLISVEIDLVSRDVTVELPYATITGWHCYIENEMDGEYGRWLIVGSVCLNAIDLSYGVEEE